MSLYTNIKFSNDLIENGSCDITYTGYLYENNSASVSIVYGFGPEWKHTMEQKMEKTENGFVATINLIGTDSLNFCFRNAESHWDNNYGKNFTTPIKEKIITEIEENKETPNFIINDDSVLKNILTNLFESNISELDSTPISQNILNENIVTNVQTVENLENNDFEIEIEINEPVNIEETLVNVTEAENLDQDIENLFTDIYENATELSAESNVVVDEPIYAIEAGNIEVANESINENFGEQENGFDMNNLIDEILSPIVKSSIFDEIVNENLEDYTPSQNDTSFFNSFDEFEEDSKLNNKIDNLIADLFNNTKQAKKAEQKVDSTITIETSAFETEPEVQAETTTTIENQSIEIESREAIENKINGILSQQFNEIFQEDSKESEVQNDIVENFEIEKIEDPKTTPTIDFDELLEDVEEESLIETLNDNEKSNENTALIEIPQEKGFTVSARSLGKFYMFKKKVKLAFTKLFFTIPRMLKKGFNTENN